MHRFTFHLGRRSVVLEYLGPAHCDGDIVVHLPDNGIVFAGDLLFVGRFPAPARKASGFGITGSF